MTCRPLLLLPLLQADLVQCHNLSWFGYPDDTSPSARDFLPGLAHAGGAPPPSQPPPLTGGDEGGAGAGGSVGASAQTTPTGVSVQVRSGFRVLVGLNPLY